MMARIVQGFVCGVLAVAAVTSSGCNRGADKKTKAPQPVLTVTVVPAGHRMLESTMTVTGAVAAWQPLSVSPAANGLQVVQVMAEEGQQVAKGAVLAQLDDRAVRAQLADARARLASAEASLQKTRFPSRPEDFSTSRATLAEAETRVREAQTDYERYRVLHAEGGVSDAELGAKQMALASARTALQQAKDRMRVMEVGGRSEDVRMAQATVAQARAAVAQMELQLAQTKVVAPSAGLILTKSVLLGDVAAVGKPMFTLARDNRLEMAGNVAEADMPRLKPGLRAKISSDALPDLKAVGTIRAISPSLSATSRLATVKIDLPAGTGFKPGMFARAEVGLGQVSSLVVPAESVVNQDGASRVFIVTDGVAHAREVVPGDTVGAWTPIRSGLQPNESVVAEGAAFLKEGDVVTVAADPTPPSASPSAKGE